MGNPKGFMQWQRSLPTKESPAERIKHSKEMVLPQSEQQSQEQAGRCMDCGVPVCQQGCPLGNMIPDWNDYVYKQRWRQAYDRLEATNNFPEFTGRLCPAPCEAACVLSINQDPVTIEQMEKEIIEHAFAQGWVTPKPPASYSDKRVAIVGSGPAGLAAAAQLNRAGHRVVVFEADDALGGMLRYGIPDFKLEKWVVDRRLALLREEGIEFRTSSPIGKSPSWSELHSNFDALLIATGAQTPRDLACPGRELRGVTWAMDFLRHQNRRIAGSGPVDESLSAKGKDVVILGGGDTGSDCLGTSLRQGAKSVTQIELFPAPSKTRPDHTPWPQWPLVLKTSTSHEEGGVRSFAVMTQSLLGEQGALTGLSLTRVQIVDGAPKAIAGTEFELPADLLLLAIGFTGPITDALTSQLGVNLTQRGAIAVDSQYATSVEGVFAAGDSRRGASLIVWAIADGREAARAIDLYLRKSTTPTLPSKGIDAPFED